MRCSRFGVRSANQDDPGSGRQSCTRTRDTTSGLPGGHCGSAESRLGLPGAASTRANDWVATGGWSKEPSHTTPQATFSTNPPRRAKIGVQGLLALCAWLAQWRAAQVQQGGAACPALPSSGVPPAQHPSATRAVGAVVGRPAAGHSAPLGAAAGAATRGAPCSAGRGGSA